MNQSGTKSMMSRPAEAPSDESHSVHGSLLQKLQALLARSLHEPYISQ
jgi:hypothetical protein